MLDGTIVERALSNPGYMDENFAEAVGSVLP